MKNNLAFVFPGQGSQRVGMLAEIAGQFQVVPETFAQASDVLGYDLWELAQKGEQSAINLTECTQPLLLSASVALWRVWEQQNGASPAMMAGHSLGEWSALVCSEVVAFPDAVQLVRCRGAYMQEAVPADVGAMAAIIGLDDAVIIDACQSAAGGEIVVPVNFNSPGQVVIAGHVAAVERAIESCKAAGAKRALPLPVSAPFHTPLMKPAADRLAGQIKETEFNTPKIPVVHNVDAATELDPASIKKKMIEQIYQPVLWVDCVNTLTQNGIDTTIECGPGKVLSGLSKRIDRSINTLSIEDPDGLENALANT